MEVLAKYIDRLRLFNRDVLLYFASWAMIGFGHMGIAAVLFNLYLLRLGLGPEIVGLVNGASQLVFAATCILTGLLGRRFSSRTLMISGMSFSAAGMGLVLTSEYFPHNWQAMWLTIVYSLSWFGAALYVVSSMPFLTRITTGENRDHAFAIRMALNNLFAILGSLVSGTLPGLLARWLHVTLDNPAPYRYPLWITCFLYSIAIFILLGTSKQETSDSKVSGVDGAAQVDVQKTAPYGLIGFLALIMLLTIASSSSLQIYFNVYLDSELAVSTLLIGVLSAVKQLLSIFLALIAPLVAEKWGKERTIVAGFLLRSVCMLPIALIPHWIGAGLGYIGAVSTVALTSPSFDVYRQESVEPRWRIVMSGAISAAIGLSAAVLAYIGASVITTWGYRELFLITFGMVTFGTLLFWLHTRMRNR
jgi:MFS family permease